MILIVSMILATLAAAHPHHGGGHHGGYYNPKIVADAIQWNTIEAAKQYRLMRPFNTCMDDLVARSYIVNASQVMPAYQCIAHGTGDLNVLFVGNSYSHRASALIHETLLGNGAKYSTLRLFAMSACNPTSHTDPCTDFWNAGRQVAKLQKPDIIFLIFNTYYNTTCLDPIDKLATDTTAAILRNHVGSFAALAPHVIYDTTFETPSVMTAATMVTLLSNHSSLADMKMNYRDWMKQAKPYYKRISTFDFDKVVTHYVSKDVCEGEWCYLYTPKYLRALYTDNLHFSPEGLQFQKKSYTKILKKQFPGLL